MKAAFKVERRGRKRKLGKRYPSGDVKREPKCTFADYLLPLLGECLAIYIMEAGAAVKIGISNDPGRRAKALQTGSAAQIKPMWRLWLRKADAQKVERSVHAELRKSSAHAVGEMYWMDVGRAAEVVGAHIQRLGVRAWSEAHFGYTGAFR